MQRRQLLLAGLALPAVAAWPSPGRARVPVAGSGFNADTVPTIARTLAAAPHVPVSRALPSALAGLGYDQYRDYRYRTARALWRDDGLPFQLQFFHRGYMFQDRVDMHLVEDGRTRPFPYSRELFDFDHGVPMPPEGEDLGFAGFRLHAPVQRADHFDELASFLGASYFRAVARGLGYGLSARGLALGSGDPGAEEFPVFRAFWLERPDPGAARLVVHALLDSPSVAGAFRFAIAPGEETVFDVDARLYPRVALASAGIAPLTSMFEFDAHDRVGIDDVRPAVHDSDGLALWTGGDEQAWRPLRNPSSLEHSGFQDHDPRGFGLMQRKREAGDFQDIEAGYEKRPSCWVEPIDPWGAGEVHLVEIPTRDEYNDNIVAFWRPAEPLAAGREHRFRYRLHWCRDHAWHPRLARVAASRSGAREQGDGRLYVVDFSGGELDARSEGVRVQASASAGTLRNAVTYRNPETGGWRMSFELEAGTARAIELRAWLEDDHDRLSETWLSRWTP